MNMSPEENEQDKSTAFCTLFLAVVLYTLAWQHHPDKEFIYFTICFYLGFGLLFVKFLLSLPPNPILEKFADFIGTRTSIQQVLFFPDDNYLCKDLQNCRRKSRCSFLHTRQQSNLLKIRDWIHSTRKTLDIAVFYFSSEDLFTWVKDLRIYRPSVYIRVILNDPTNCNSIDYQSEKDKTDQLLKLGISVRIRGTKQPQKSLMHHKFAVQDGSSVLTGSFNWTKAAARFNSEAVMIISDSKLAAKFTDEFERLWYNASGEDMKKIRLAEY